MIFKLNENKELQCTKTSVIYSGESNIDFIQVIIPKEYNSQDMYNCIVDINITLPNDFVLTKRMIKKQGLYKGYLVFYIPITADLTQDSGVLSLCIDITNRNTVLKSGTSHMEVKDRKG